MSNKLEKVMAVDLKIAASTEIKVRKGVPLPVISIVGKYPWKTLEIGDSFLFPASHMSPHQAVSYANLKFAPRKFTSRKTPEGVGCWRVA